MSHHSTIQIDSTHYRAICDEIGERLRVILDGEASALPPRLQVLLLRLAEQDMAGKDSAASPSIAAAIDGMVPGSIRAA